MNKQPVWFITGASKGMGLALTKSVLAKGHKVAATTRTVEALQANITGHREDLLALQVDITSDGEVKAAIEQVVSAFGHVDVVVNNAGYSLVGSMEEITDAEFRQTLDVNLFGTVNVIRAVMPYLRAQQSGRVINISSNAGYVGFANAASYNAAKFAVVGLSEALAQEVNPFGVKVTVVAPGQFRTHFMDKGSMRFAKNKIDVYKLEEAQKMWSQYSGQQPGDPEKLVQILVDIASHPDPPQHLSTRDAASGEGKTGNGSLETPDLVHQF
jgi:NAD(P)-dependent dehydrogenase (short-subunit alcohol dehydrogenase family)